jgi:hypothetical protein
VSANHTTPFFDNLLERTETLLKTKLSQVEFQVLLKSAKLFAWLFKNLFLCLLLVGILALLNLSLGYLLGDLLGQRYYGFLALSFGYFLTAGILRIFRSYLLQRPIANSIVKQLQHQLSDKGE